MQGIARVQTPPMRRLFLHESVCTLGAMGLPSLAFKANVAGQLRQVTVKLDWIFQGPNDGRRCRIRAPQKL
jgi:hypothetical protein